MLTFRPPRRPTTPPSSQRPPPSTPRRNILSNPLAPQTPRAAPRLRTGLPQTEPPWPSYDPSNDSPYIRPGAKIDDPDPNQLRQRMLTALDRGGGMELFEEMVRIDKQYILNETPLLPPNDRKMNGQPSHLIRTLSYSILMTYPRELLVGLIRGDFLTLPNLKHLVKDRTITKRPVGMATTKTKGLVQTAHSGPENHPCIYMHTTATYTGEVPTRGQQKAIVDALELYIEPSEKYLAGRSVTPSAISNQIAARVDAFKPNSEKPKPNYSPKNGPYDTSKIPQGARKYVFNKGVLEKMRRWINYQRKMLAALGPGDDDTPMPFSTTETGWSVIPVARTEKQHANHQNSVQLMNAVEAICSFILKDPNLPTNIRTTKIFRSRVFIIIDVWSEPCASLAEHIHSVVASSYIWMGGYNGTVAGQSVQGAVNAPSYVWEYWAGEQDMDMIRKNILIELQHTEEIEEGARVIHTLEDTMKVASANFHKAKRLEEDIVKNEKLIQDAMDATEPSLDVLIGKVEDEIARSKQLEETLELLDTVIPALKAYLAKVNGKQSRYGTGAFKVDLQGFAASQGGNAASVAGSDVDVE